jgi:hypothetical protein
MKFSSAQKKVFLALLAGLITLFLSYVLITFLEYQLANALFEKYPPSQLRDVYSEPPFKTYHQALQIISFVSPILSGIVSGWFLKKKEWWVGIILGLILIAFPVALNTWLYLSPDSKFHGLASQADLLRTFALKRIWLFLVNSPWTLLRTTLGVYLGSSLSEKWKK